MSVSRQRHGWSWAVVLAALMLVLQAFLGGLAAGAAALPATSPAVVVCAFHLPAEPPDRDHGKGSAGPDCCRTGSCAFSIGDLPARPRVPVPRLVGDRRDTASLAAATPRAAVRRGLCGCPRAPPTVA